MNPTVLTLPDPLPLARTRSGNPATPAPAARRLRVAIVNPKFEPSYWGFDFALPLMPGDRRCWVVTGALPALAALAPSHCDVEIVDENVEDINFERLRDFDVVGVTGMIVQRVRMHEILQGLRGGQAIVAVGGPYASVAEDAFEGLCDTVFVGEAEETWPVFLEAVARDAPLQKRYRQPDRTDMASVPTPRYDLVRGQRYVMASLQFSRGCPFMCEFCDIITVFGRRPRLKTPVQMLAELDQILAAGFRSCFLVDDNFIGNKGKAKELLRAIVDWQRARNFPLVLVTEASINLADDEEMLALMTAANFRQVFVGIESPSKEALISMHKTQNVRGDSLEAKLQRIRDGGLVVNGGFIVGFDTDTEEVFDQQFEFIQRSGIAQATVAILSPIPTTPLYERLRDEGRLDFSDPDVAFHPRLMSRAALKAGFDDLLRRLYAPEAYFERLFAGYAGSAPFRRLALTRNPRGVGARLRSWLAAARQGIALGRAMARDGQLWRLVGSYAGAWQRYNRPLRDEAIPFASFIGLCVVHWHYYKLSRLPRKAGFGTVLDLAHEPSAAS
ncbi:radical SAM protein [Agrilutibacter solisilvae]|uniref:DUF4070 domain-containing protein n=1 Tax=Agrilutibacter solisilvae TaxID=2763317 RepID=A0A974XYU2_9GAMM|nr:radical SAM protein [Lysobacter solisilvae]QSX77450.1 DUF4070 domain-containing protein [Lysobacter solisilvae]